MGNHISKQERQRRLADKFNTELALQNALRGGSKLNNSFLEILDKIRLEEVIDYQNERMICVIQFIRQNRQKNKKATVEMWLENIVFLTQNVEKKCPDWFKDITYIRALMELCKYRTCWIRPLEDWKPQAKSNYERFKELIAYLLATYAYPKFLSHIFFHEQDHFFIRDFIFLAQGGSIKAIYSTITLTQKMRVEFLKTPEGFRVFEAFRYAQVKALGGDDFLAHRIAYSWLGHQDEREESLWEQFIKILIAGGMFNHDKISELIDFVRRQLAENRAYSLKGRTLGALIRQSDEWHRQISKHGNVQTASIWQSVGYKPFEIVEGEGKYEVKYLMRELLSNKELTDEGAKMGHCVASYSQYCERGSVRIFSLRKLKNGVEVERMATIEVDTKHRVVVQAKHRFNNAIGEKAQTLLQDWAALQGLIIKKYL